jgi:hypothetical protein
MDSGIDPLEAGLRERVCGFIQELLEQELTAALGRGKSERAAGEPKGYRNGVSGSTARVPLLTPMLRRVSITRAVGSSCSSQVRMPASNCISSRVFGSSKAGLSRTGGPSAGMAAPVKQRRLVEVSR